MSKHIKFIFPSFFIVFGQWLQNSWSSKISAQRVHDWHLKALLTSIDHPQVYCENFIIIVTERNLKHMNSMCTLFWCLKKFVLHEARNIGPFCRCLKSENVCLWMTHTQPHDNLLIYLTTFYFFLGGWGGRLLNPIHSPWAFKSLRNTHVIQQCKMFKIIQPLIIKWKR